MEYNRPPIFCQHGNLGFDHSTETAVLRVLSDILLALDRGDRDLGAASFHDWLRQLRRISKSLDD